MHVHPKSNCLKILDFFRKNAYSLHMKKYIKLAALTLVTSAITFLIFEKVLANKNDIKIQPAFEATKKYNNFVQNGLSCPRTISPDEPLSTVNEQSESSEYEHCSSCKMGVFFKSEEGGLACSYCSLTKN